MWSQAGSGPPAGPYRSPVGDEEILDLALGVEPSRRDPLIRAQCIDDERRYQRLSALARLAASVTTTSQNQGGQRGPLVPQGTHFDRYVILEHLGSGGMGSVYAAYDRELQRRVALKLLRLEDEPRVVREARLMARVEHASIVRVYDVGTYRGQPFISMELVTGVSLRTWLQSPRSWPDALRVMLAAGRGLEAAHRVGVVHHDFKPENVLLSPNGRGVKVTDFGVARLAASAVSTSDAATVAPSVTLPESISAVGGTPGYVAPEQIGRLPSNARADVYAYAVVLFEALFGERPRPSDSHQSATKTPERRGRVPRWLVAAVERGLRPNPEERWPSITALIAHLRFRARLRWVLRILMLAILCVGVALMALQLATMRTRAQCDAEGMAIARTWGDTDAAALQTAFEHTGVSYARDAAERTAGALQEYAAGWREQRSQICVATRIERAMSADQRQHAESCLRDGRAQLAALVQMLTQPDESVIVHAVEAALSLPSPQTCTSDRTLARSQPAGIARDVWLEGPGRQRLARVHALLSARRLEHAARAGLQLSHDAAEREHWPTAIEAQLLAASAHRRLGEHHDTEPMLRDAFRRASEHGYDYLALRAAAQLTGLEGVERIHPERGAIWADIGATLVARLRLGDDPAVARLAANVGDLEFERGDFELASAAYERGHRTAIRAFGAQHPTAINLLVRLARTQRSRGQFAAALSTHRRVLALQESMLGPDHPDIATYVSNVAALLMDHGEFDDALAHYRRALAINTRVIGPDSLAVASELSNIGSAHARLGRLEASRQAQERALRIRERQSGDQHPDVAQSLHELALLDAREGSLDRALARRQHALAILESAYGMQHPKVAAVLSGIGAAHSALGDHQMALATYARARTIAESIFGPDHINVGWLLHNTAVAQQRLNDETEALRSSTRAVPIIEQALGPEHPQLVEPLRTLGIALFRAGRSDAAIDACERALAIAEAGNRSTRQLARARFSLAKALRATGRTPPRAHRLATAAHDYFVEDHDETAASEVQRWLEVDR